MYAILRGVKKLSTVGHIRAAGGHNDRTIEPEHINADPKLVPQSRFGPLAANDVVKAVLAKIPEKRRKDAVLAVEQVLSASPEFFKKLADRWHPDQVETWARKAVNWLKQTHGENLISVTLHLDETTPHLHAIVTPMTADGRLCAKEYTSRKRLIEWQTSFAKEMASMGLRRGVEGSGVKHRTLAEFRKMVATPVPQMPRKPVKPVLGMLEQMSSAGKAKQQAFEDAAKKYREATQKRQESLIANAKLGIFVGNTDQRVKRAVKAEEQAEEKQRKAQIEAKKAEENRISIENLEKSTLISCAKLINGMPRDQLAKALNIELGRGDVIDQLRRRGLVNDLREGVAFVSERIDGADLVEMATWSDELAKPESPRLGM